MRVHQGSYAGQRRKSARGRVRNCHLERLNIPADNRNLRINVTRKLVLFRLQGSILLRLKDGINSSNFPKRVLGKPRDFSGRVAIDYSPFPSKSITSFLEASTFRLALRNLFPDVFSVCSNALSL
jgi:hypothetical protein